MVEGERRRSVRHLLGVTAEVHVGPETVLAVIHDVAAHGMGLVMPRDLKVSVGDVVWILAGVLSSYAITATVVRVANGWIGVELDEVLSGPTLETVEALPVAESGDLLVDSLDLAPATADLHAEGTSMNLDDLPPHEG